MADRDDVAIRVDGLREYQRGLKRVSPEVAKGLTAAIKAAAGKIATDARAHAVRRTGKYAASIRPYVTARGASVGSRLPQAGVLHYGGTIRPRGVDITFAARPVVSDAAERGADRLVEDIGDAIEQAAQRAGFRT